MGLLTFSDGKIIIGSKVLFGEVEAEHKGPLPIFFRPRPGVAVVLAESSADEETLEGFESFQRVETSMALPPWAPSYLGGRTFVGACSLVSEWQDIGPMSMNTNDRVQVKLDVRIRFKVVSPAAFVVRMQKNIQQAFVDTLSSALNEVTSNFSSRELVALVGTPDQVIMTLARQEARLSFIKEGMVDEISTIDMNRKALEIADEFRGDEKLLKVLQELSVHHLAKLSKEVLEVPTFSKTFGIKPEEVGIKNIILPTTMQEAEQERVSARAKREALADQLRVLRKNLETYRDVFTPSVEIIAEAVSKVVHGERR